MIHRPDWGLPTSAMRRVARIAGSPVAVLHGPTGAGKSQVLAAWVRLKRDQGHTVDWIDLHSWTGGEALQAPVIALDAVDPANADHRQLIDEVGQRIRSGQVTEVLLASREAVVHDLVTTLHLSPMRLGPAALRLDLDEVEEAAERAGATISGRRLALAHRLADGWPAFVDVAIAVILEFPEATDEQLTSAYYETVRNRWGESVDADQVLLLQTSDVWPNAGQEASDGAESALVEAERAGVVARDSASSSIWRTVRPIAHALRVQLTDPRTARFDRRTVAQVRRELTTELLQSGRVADAAQVAIVADQAEPMAAVFRAAAARTDCSSLGVVARAAAQHAESWFEADDVLLTGAAVHGADREPPPPTIQGLRGRVTDRATTLSGDPSERLLVLGLRTALFRLGGDIDRSAEQALLVVDSFRQSATAQPGTGGVAVHALNQAAITFMLSDSFAAADEVARDALEAAHGCGTDDAVAVAAATLALACAVRGDMSGSQVALRAADAVPDAVDRAGLRSILDLSRAFIQIEAADFGRARQHLDDAWRAGQDSEFWWLIQALNAIVTLITTGDAGTAAELSQSIERSADRGRVVTGPRLRVALSSQLALLARKPGLAVRLTSRPDDDSELFVILQALGELTLGRTERAARMAGSVVTSQSYRVRAGAALVAAVTAAERNQTSVAAERLREAMSTMRRTGLRSPLRFLAMDARSMLLELDLATGEAAELRSWLEVPVQIPAPAQHLARLSEREVQLLIGFRDEHTLGEIAEKLGISINTVKTLTGRLYRKLGVSDKAAAVERAMQAHLLE